MIGFFHILADSLCRNFSNITRRKQKNASSNLQTDHKKRLVRPRFSRKTCKELFTFVSAMVKRHARQVYNASFHVFLVGLRYCKLALLHYCAQEISGRHGEASCYRDYSTHFKTIIKKASGFQACCLQVSSKKFRAVL